MSSKPKNLKKEKGIALILALMVLSLMLSAGFGVGILLFQEMKMSRNAGDSVVAFYAAETGLEQVLLNRDNPSSSCTEASPCSLDNGAQYFISITPQGADCPSPNSYCIKSIGIFKNTQRGLEADY